MERGSPGKPKMRIRDNWLLMSLLKGSISSAPATKEILDELKSACDNGAMVGKYGKGQMNRLFDLAKKDEFSTIYTGAAMEKYAKEGLLDMEEHIKFLEAVGIADGNIHPGSRGGNHPRHAKPPVRGFFNLARRQPLPIR